VCVCARACLCVCVCVCVCVTGPQHGEEEVSLHRSLSPLPSGRSRRFHFRHGGGRRRGSRRPGARAASLGWLLRGDREAESACEEHEEEQEKKVDEGEEGCPPSPLHHSLIFPLPFLSNPLLSFHPFPPLLTLPPPLPLLLSPRTVREGEPKCGDTLSTMAGCVSSLLPPLPSLLPPPSSSHPRQSERASRSAATPSARWPAAFHPSRPRSGRFRRKRPRAARAGRRGGS
jgi:hypothetical protein